MYCLETYRLLSIILVSTVLLWNRSTFVDNPDFYVLLWNRSTFIDNPGFYRTALKENTKPLKWLILAHLPPLFPVTTLILKPWFRPLRSAHYLRLSMKYVCAGKAPHNATPPCSQRHQHTVTPPCSQRHQHTVTPPCSQRHQHTATPPCSQRHQHRNTALFTTPSTRRNTALFPTGMGR